MDVSSDMLNSSNTNNLNQIVMDASVFKDNKNLNNQNKKYVKNLYTIYNECF